MSFLTGKKTYIVAVCAILYAIFGYVSGNLDANTGVQGVLAALAVCGLRNGLTTEIGTAAKALLPPNQGA